MRSFQFLILVLLDGALPCQASAQNLERVPTRKRAMHSQCQTTSDLRAAADGSALSPEQAQQLEKQLVQHPDDLSARSKLLGYYLLRAFDTPSARSARQRHIFWIIAHHPEAAIAGTPEVYIDQWTDGAAFTQAKRLWLQQVSAYPKNAKVAGNAAAFLLLSDRALSERLFKRAQALAPSDPDWAQQLGHLYQLQMSSLSGPERQAMARQALAQYEAWFHLQREPQNDYSALDDMAMVAFEAGAWEKARQYAVQLLNWATSAGANPSSRAGNAIHKGNLVLGRLALRAGDVPKARSYLLAAGRTPGSPQLDSFGPNMTLAREFLKHGERNVVLQYFQECAAFWQMGQENLKQWSEEVKAGQIPDFGANLDY
jgi:tetratricopeptide (TPR) repeat protein